MQSFIPDEEKSSPMKNAIDHLNGHGIFARGPWIQHILILIRKHPKPEQLAVALTTINRYFPGLIKYASPDDENIRKLFNQMSQEPFIDILDFIILKELHKKESSPLKSEMSSFSLPRSYNAHAGPLSFRLSSSLPTSVFCPPKPSQQDSSKRELVAALNWLKLLISNESERFAFDLNLLLFLKDLILSLKEYKQPLLLAASYAILNKLSQPSWKLQGLVPNRKLRLDTIYYYELDGVLEFLFPHSYETGETFKTDLNFKTESEHPDFIKKLWSYLDKVQKLTPQCCFDKLSIMQMMLKLELPFTFAMIIEKIFSLPFWVNIKYQDLMNQVLEMVARWSGDSELTYYLLSRLSEAQLTPEFFEKLIQLSSAQTMLDSASIFSLDLETDRRPSFFVDQSTTSVICQWIKQNLLNKTSFYSDVQIEDEKSPTQEGFENYLPYLIQERRFSMLFPATKIPYSLFGIDKIRKEEFFESVNTQSLTCVSKRF